MLHYKSIHFLILIVATSNAALLPDYFNKCSLSDPKLNACLTKNAIDAWPSIYKGDKTVHLQDMDPLNVPFLTGNIHNHLTVNITNAVISGFANMKVNEIKLDQNEHVIDLNISFPHFNIMGFYGLQGELISIPVNGQGSANVTFYNMDDHLRIDYELIEKNDKHYIKLVKKVMNYNITLLSVYMEQLGETVNSILNENWDAVNKEVAQEVSNVYGEVLIEILRAFFKKVSFEDLFSK